MHTSLQHMQRTKNEKESQCVMHTVHYLYHALYECMQNLNYNNVPVAKPGLRPGHGWAVSSLLYASPPPSRNGPKAPGGGGHWSRGSGRGDGGGGAVGRVGWGGGVQVGRFGVVGVKQRILSYHMTPMTQVIGHCQQQT